MAKGAKLSKPFRNRIVGHGEEPVDQLLANPRNFRLHPDNQQQALAGAIDDIGFIRSVTVNKITGCVVDGHLRVTLAMRSGVESLPVEYVELDEAEEAEALMMLDPIASMAATDKQKLDELMRQVQSDDERVQQMMAELAEREKLYTQEKPQGKPNPRKLPIDVIYTLQMADCTCCLAVQAGWKYGIQSAQYRLCPYTYELSGRHEVAFIDNDYFKYDHAVHLKAVSELKPKYATVRDAMTPEQCVASGIEYYPLEQILEWAEELGQYAQNVIVIPKYQEALERIPEKFMLGYSVPTSHGGTPLPVENFKGRRVHLLGGSWKDQLAHMAVLGDDIVSLDNNAVNHTAGQYGLLELGDGRTVQLKEFFPNLNNPRYVALAISFGNIANEINMLCGNKNPADLGGGE